MPVRFGFEPLGNIASEPNVNLSAELAAYERDYWPPHVQHLASIGSAIALANTPMEHVAKARQGNAPMAYFNDFYFRVHITPARLDLGNLVTTQLRSIAVWNAWPDQAQSLTELHQVAADGITATGEGALPLAFAPLQQRTWQIAVSTDGPPVIAATLSWLFAGLDPLPVMITGNRLTAWTIPPRWHNGILERLEWLTEVQQAADGNVDAYPLRDTPHRTWEFDTQVAGADRWLLEASLYDWSARNWAFPVAVDAVQLAALLPAASSSIPLATAYLDYTLGGLAMLWSSPTTYELVEVDQIAADALLLVRPTVNAWPAGTRVYPVRITRLAEQPQLQQPTTRYTTGHVRMEAVEPCDWPAIAPTATYDGYPVLEHRVEVSTAPTVVYGRQLEVLDADIGPVSVDDETGLAWITQSHVWKLQGRAARAAQRSLLYYFAGRVNRVWLPTWQDDMMLAANVSATAQTIDVAWCGYTRFLHGQPGRTQLRIELVGGTVLYRAITDWSEVDANTERLTLSAALGQTVTPAQVAQISYMSLSALASDAVEIQHDTDSEGSAAVVVQFAQVSGNE